jgi:hypothetical protein
MTGMNPAVRADHRIGRRLARSSAVAGLLLAVGSAMASSLENIDLSGSHPDLAAGVPVVAVDANRPAHVAVAWRFIDPLPPPGTQPAAGNWECHLSISDDGGKSFRDQVIAWHIASSTRCNAPWVAFSPSGDLYLAATLTGVPPSHAAGGAPPDAAEPRPHPTGTVGFMASHDDGRTWDAAVSAIPSNALDRFDTDASIPDAAKHVPWDGARGAVDSKTGTLYLSGAFPAPPGGAEHSQRFYSASTDGGKTFGAIRAFGSIDWPERWDGDIAAAGGDFVASYIGDATQQAAGRCPCAVVAWSHDGGKTLTHHWMAGADQLDVDTLVHYPELAADPRHRNRFALALISAKKDAVSVYVTNDGNAWTKSTVTQPSDIATVTRPAIAFSPEGVLVVAWRGVRADGTYDIYAAASIDGRRFGRTARVSTQSSRTPDAWLKTYAVRGDFHTSIAASRTAVHVAWADARNGKDVRVVYARVALRDVLP